MNARSSVLAVLVGAALLVAPAGLSACSSSAGSSLPDQVPNATGSSPTAAPGGAFGTAVNKQYGISMRCPLGWVSATSTAKPSAKGDPLLQLMWANPKGKAANGHLIDALEVSVYALTKPVKPGDVGSHTRDFEAIAYGMIKSLPQLDITDPPKLITVNGTTGIQVTYTYGEGGAPTGAMSYLLPKGRYAYWITGQSSAATWQSSWAKLAPSMASFTIGAVAAK